MREDVTFVFTTVEVVAPPATRKVCPGTIRLEAEIPFTETNCDKLIPNLRLIPYKVSPALTV